MKKITGFFLALLPIFVLVLLFISGMLIKDYTHVYVQAVEFGQETAQIQKKTDDETKYTEQLQAHVLPFNATNPEVYYRSSNENVVTVDDNGVATAVDFGFATIYATSKENETITASCEVEVWDDKIHRIDVRNYDGAGYIGLYQDLDLQAVPVPSTHIEGDMTLLYTPSESASNYISVSPSGVITGEALTKGAEISVRVSTKEATQVKPVDVPVVVGAGVNAIEFEKEGAVVTSNTEYPLYDEILTYPESEKANVPPTDFDFECVDNAPIADIDPETGIVKFKAGGTVTVKATYKRNQDLTLTKKITCTNNGFLDVSFNRYRFQANLEDYATDKEIKHEDINWTVYPSATETQKATITSTNPAVVSCEDDKLLVKGAGRAILTATVTTPDGKQMSDYCLVDIIKPIEGDFLNTDSVTVTDKYSYYLRNKVIPGALDDPHEKINWTSSDESVAIIDDADMLRFKKSGSVVITGTIGTESQQFTVNCQRSSVEAIEVAVNDMSEVVIEAGKRYSFWGQDLLTGLYTVRLVPQASTGKTLFQSLDDGTYIAMRGARFEGKEFHFYDSTGLIDWADVDLTVTEKDVYDLYYDPANMLYITSETNVDFADIVSFAPKTAYDEKGQKIVPDVVFEAESEDMITVTNNVITFKKDGGVRATVTYDKKDYVFYIFNTLGKPGKFDLRDTQSNKTIFSGETITIDSDTPSILYLNQRWQDVSIETFDRVLEMGSLNGDSSPINYGHELDPVTDNIYFTFEVKQGGSGSDVIYINTGNFIFYLNVEIAPSIKSFELYWQNQRVGENQISYTKNLDLNIVVKPIKHARESDLYKLYLTTPNETAEIDVTDEIDTATQTFSLSSHISELGNYILRFVPDTTKIRGQEQSFTIQYKDPATITGFEVEGSMEKPDYDGKLSIACGATQTTIRIRPVGGGFVDETFFDDIRVEIPQREGEHVVVSETPDKRGRIYVTNIPVPTAETNGKYENEIHIKQGEQEAKKYFLARDIVSRVKFPGHDNNLLDDQRGLQKVHVYGNTSMYSPEEGVVNYYKLPFELYDFQGNVIVNTEQNPTIIHDAYETLVPSYNNDLLGHVEFPVITPKPGEIAQETYLKVYFNDLALLNQQEVYDNLFADPANNRNFNFSLSTQSKLAQGQVDAQYTFVAVNGINAYCQEALAEGEGISRNKVLQTNFGLEGAAQDNAPLTDSNIDQLYTIYGNGYTILLEARQKLRVDDLTEFPIHTQYALNVTIQGCNDAEMAESVVSIKPRGSQQESDPKNLMAYSTVKNTQYGINGWYYTDNTRYYVKNSIFYNNASCSLCVNANDNDVGQTDMYVEKTVLFNCSATALLVAMKGRLFVKDFVDIYNFKGKEILDLTKTPVGLDLRQFWTLLSDAAKEQDMTQISSSGETKVNSSIICTYPDTILFWDGNNYVVSDHGLPTACQYVKKFIDLPQIETFQISVWATPNPEHNPGAPSYYDQFDPDGNVNWQFLNNQISKVIRLWKPLPYIVQ